RHGQSPPVGDGDGMMPRDWNVGTTRDVFPASRSCIPPPSRRRAAPGDVLRYYVPGVPSPITERKLPRMTPMSLEKSRPTSQHAAKRSRIFHDRISPYGSAKFARQPAPACDLGASSPFAHQWSEQHRGKWLPVPKLVLSDET